MILSIGILLTYIALLFKFNLALMIRFIWKRVGQ